MLPILFNISFLGRDIIIRSYTFFACMGMIFVILSSILVLKKNNHLKFNNIVILSILGFSLLLGARLFDGLMNSKEYINNFYKIFEIRIVGFSIIGGIITAIISGFVIYFYLSKDILIIGDLLTLYIGVGIILWRIGCFLNGCCFGTITNLPWGIPYLKNSEYIHVHPTQIYEIIFVIISLIIAYIIYRVNKQAGSRIISFIFFFLSFHVLNLQFLYFEGLESISSKIILYSTYFLIVLFFLILLIKWFLLKRKSIQTSKY